MKSPVFLGQNPPKGAMTKKAPDLAAEDLGAAALLRGLG